MKQMDVLDGIRGYAIITVMLYHFTQQFQHMAQSALTSTEWIFARTFEGMWLGVDLFFVMSGFLITNILLGTVGQDGYYKNFYVRRFLRIFPLYYAVLLMLMVVAPMLSASLMEQTQPLRDDAIYFLTYTINWRIAYLGDFREISAGYMWSLAVEEQFYMVWPLIVAAFHRHLAKVCFTLVGVGLLAKIYLFNAGLEGPSIYAATLTHMDGLLLGAGFASLYRKNNQKVPLIAADIIKILALISVVGMSVLILKNGHLAFYEGLNPVVGVTAFSLIFLALLIYALESPQQGVAYSLFTIRPIMFCGKLCYGLYLLHHPIGVLVEKVLFGKLAGYSPLLSAVAVSAVSLVVSLIVAYLSFHLFEKHFLGLKRHFEPKKVDGVEQPAIEPGTQKAA